MLLSKGICEADRFRFQRNLVLAVSDPPREARSFWKISRNNIKSSLSSFQQAVVRNVNDKNAQLQKQLENVVREGNQFVLSAFSW
jgi:hypothetical protein